MFYFPQSFIKRKLKNIQQRYQKVERLNLLLKYFFPKKELEEVAL